MRSGFKIEQFERVLQKLAHEFPRFHRVTTDDVTLVFSYHDDGSPRRLSVQVHKRTGKKDKWGNPEIEWWSFSVEPKLYMTSEDATKIAYGYKEEEEKITKFIEKIMASEKVIPRFTLSQRKP